MQHAELATLLVDSSDANREALLWGNSALADLELGYRLKDICLEGWSTHPRQALAAAASLRLLAQMRPSPEMTALSAWSQGTHRREDAVGDFRTGKLRTSVSHDR